MGLTGRHMRAGKPYPLQRGFTYLAVLFLVAVVGLLTAKTALLWSTLARREREQELLFVGDQYRKAIAQYYWSTPGGDKHYPPSLDALLQDPRFPGARRYLRKVYRDPITDLPQWGIIRAPDGGIMGIYSMASGVPLKQAGFPEKYKDFSGNGDYPSWRFVASIN